MEGGPGYIGDEGDIEGSERTLGADNGSENKISMIVITGPNYSGKSVYLKQVSKISTNLQVVFSHSLGCPYHPHGTYW